MDQHNDVTHIMGVSYSNINKVHTSVARKTGDCAIIKKKKQQQTVTHRGPAECN